MRRPLSRSRARMPPSHAAPPLPACPAVAWGIDNKKQTVEECAEACLRHVPSGEGALCGALRGPPPLRVARSDLRRSSCSWIPLQACLETCRVTRE